MSGGEPSYHDELTPDDIGQLASTVAKLETAERLAKLTQRIDCRESERDKLEVGQLAFAYELIMVQSVHLPHQIRAKTAKELESLFKEDWSERAQDQTGKDSLRQHQATACAAWQAAQARFLSDHKIRDAIRVLKRLQVGPAHPCIDLANDATFEKMKGSIQEYFDEEEQEVLICFAGRVRQLQTADITNA